MVEGENLLPQMVLWLPCGRGISIHTHKCIHTFTCIQINTIIIFKKILSIRGVILYLAYDAFFSLEAELNTWFIEFNIKWNYSFAGLKIIKHFKTRSAECETKAGSLLIIGAHSGSWLCLSSKIDGTVSQTASSTGQPFFCILRRRWALGFGHVIIRCLC